MLWPRDKLKLPKRATVLLGRATSAQPPRACRSQISSGPDWVVPIGGRLGYALHLGQVWSIRLGLRVDQYWLQSSTYQTRTWLGLELGFRWQHPSGFRAGIDLVPLGFQRWTGHDDEDIPFQFWAPAILLSQVSVGWRWSL